MTTAPDRPHIKGVPLMDILRAFAKTFDMYSTCDRFPSLAYQDIRNAIHYRDNVLIPELFDRGSTPEQVASEFGISLANACSRQKKALSDVGFRRRWGPLTPQAIQALARAGYTSLQDAKARPPHELDLLGIKGVGRITLEQIAAEVPIKRMPPPPPRMPGAGRPGRKSAPCYVTDARHLRDALFDPAAPRQIRHIALFFQALAASARNMDPDDELPSFIPCMAGPQPKWCLGTIDVRTTADPGEIYWECPLCGKNGVLRSAGVLDIPGATA